MKNNFEDSIKNKVEQFDEIPAEKIWTDISEKIKTENISHIPKNNSWKIGAALVAVVIISVVVFWKINSANENIETEKMPPPVAEENTAPEKPSAELIIAEGSGNTAKDMFPIELGNAKENGKPLMVYVCMEGCKPCARFVRETLSQPDVEDYLENNFEQVAVDMLAEDNRPFLRNYKTNASPSVLFFSPEGELLGKTTGACGKETFMGEAQNAHAKFVNNISVEKIAAEKIKLKVLPNPNNGQFEIRIKAQPAPIYVQIISQHGQEVYRKKIGDFDGHFQDQIDLTEYAKGVYFMKVKQGQSVYTERIVVQ